MPHPTDHPFDKPDPTGRIVLLCVLWSVTLMLGFFLGQQWERRGIGDPPDARPNMAAILEWCESSDLTEETIRYWASRVRAGYKLPPGISPGCGGQIRKLAQSDFSP